MKKTIKVFLHSEKSTCPTDFKNNCTFRIYQSFYRQSCGRLCFPWCLFFWLLAGFHENCLTDFDEILTKSLFCLSKQVD